MGAIVLQDAGTVRDLFFKRFSAPFNVRSWQQDPSRELIWFARYRNYISSVYSPINILGYKMRDCGDVTSKPHYTDDLKGKLRLLRNLGVNINIVINNIWDHYDLKKIDSILLKNRDLIDIVTIPDKRFAYLKQWFKVKNTAINMVNLDTIDQWRDMDIVQIHDFIPHNHDEWLAIKGESKISCCVNLGCTCVCPTKSIHYHELHCGNDLNDFCPIYLLPYALNQLRRTGIPLLRSEYLYYLDVIDEYKFAGRTDYEMYQQTKRIIERIDGGEEDLGFDIPIYGKLRDAWRVKVRNCGGDCMNCLWCNKVYEKISG